MKILFLVILILITNISAEARSGIKTYEVKQVLSQSNTAPNKVVLIKGKLHLEFESTFISDVKSGEQIWLEVNDAFFAKYQKANGQVAIVKGKLMFGKRGHMGLWKASVTDISDIKILK